MIYSRFITAIAAATALYFIPNQAEELALGLSESPRDSTIKTCPILQYEASFDRSNPESKANPKAQFCNLIGYIPAKAKTTKTRFIEKGFYDCHHSVYGRAQLLVKDAQIDVTTGKIPLTVSGKPRNIRFNNNSFVIRHTGTYIARYLFKAFVDDTISIGDSINVAIAVNGTPQGGQKLYPILPPTTYTAVYSGTGMRSLRLKKGDKVTFVVTKKPNKDFLLYENVGLPLDQPDVAASLIIFKAETKK